MSDASTIHMLEAYKEQAGAPMFLSSHFRTPPENFHNSEKVEIDIERDDEDVAIVITDLSQGPRFNENSQYTNKAFAPPIFDEAGSVNAFELIERSAGVNPFDNVDFNAAVVDRMFTLGLKLEKKIRRVIEWMSAQVLQTGTLTLVDGVGTSLFAMNFSPKANHFTTAPIDWGTGTEDKLADIATLARTIRTDGKKRPNRLIFGKDALTEFLSDPAVTALFDNRRMLLGTFDPQIGEDASFMGDVIIDNYRFEIWAYDAEFTHPNGGASTPYVTDDLVIIMATAGRLDLSFGAIPSIVPPEQRAARFLPSRMPMGSIGFDLTPNAWVTPNGRTAMISLGTRPLPIPTAIDTFGALNTVA